MPELKEKSAIELLRANMPVAGQQTAIEQLKANVPVPQPQSAIERLRANMPLGAQAPVRPDVMQYAKDLYMSGQEGDLEELERVGQEWSPEEEQTFVDWRFSDPVERFESAKGAAEAVGKVTGKIRVPMPSGKFLQEHRVLGPLWAGPAAALNVPAALIRAPFEMGAGAGAKIREAQVRGVGPVLKETAAGLVPETLKTAARGEGLAETVIAGLEELPELSAMAYGTAAGIAKGRQLYKGLRAGATPAAKKLVAAGLSKRKVRRMTPAQQLRAARRMETTRKAPPLPKKPPPPPTPEEWARKQPGLKQRVGKLRADYEAARTEFAAQAEQVRRMEAVGKRGGKYKEALGKAREARRRGEKIEVEAKRTAEGMKTEYEGVVKKAAKPKPKPPPRYTATDMRSRMDAAYKTLTREGRRKALDAVKRARERGVTDVGELDAIKNKKLKPYVQKWNRWKNELNRLTKRGEEQAAAEKMWGPEARAHAKTVAGMEREALAQKAAPPIAPKRPSYRPTPAMKAAEFPLGAKRGKPMARITFPTAEELVARGLAERAKIGGRISARATAIGRGEQVPQMFKKHGWTGKIKDAPTSVKKKVLAEVNTRLEKTLRTSQLTPPERTMRNMGLGQEADDIFNALRKVEMESAQYRGQFKKLIQSAKKRAPTDWEKQFLDAVEGDTTPKSRAVSELVQGWRNLEAQMRRRKAVPEAARRAKYFPHVKAGERGYTSAQIRRGVLAPEARASVPESIDSFIHDAMRRVHLQPTVRNLTAALDKTGMRSPHAPPRVQQFSNDLLQALSGGISRRRSLLNLGLTPSQARSLTAPIYGTTLSAPASAFQNLTQFSNTLGQQGFRGATRAFTSGRAGVIASKWKVGETSAGLVEEFGLQPAKGKLGRGFRAATRAPLKLFQISERALKRGEFKSAYNKYRGRGKVGADAALSALKDVNATQFYYDPITVPLWIQKYPLLGQFMTFPTRQGLLLWDWLATNPEAALRYSAASYGLARGARKAGIRPEPYSIPGMAPAGLAPIPQTLVGVTDVIGAALAGDKKGMDRAVENLEMRVAGLLGRVIVASRKGYRLAKTGEVRSRRTGELLLRDDSPDRMYHALLYALGFTPEQHSKYYQKLRQQRMRVRNIAHTDSKYADAYMKILSSPLSPDEKKEALRELMKSASEDGAMFSVEMVKNRYLNLKVTLAERAQRALPKKTRARLQQRGQLEPPALPRR